MSYSNRCKILLRFPLVLLLVLYEVHTVPALPDAATITAVNSIEESDKLPDTNVALSASQEASGLVGSNATNQASESEDQIAPGDNVASASSNEPVSIYAGGLITPEAFQHYLSQYGGAANLAPLAAYPAPMAAPPGLYPYPGPIMVQTGYEGFLVPANSAAADTTAPDVGSVVTTPSSANNNPLIAFASRLLPTILMSTLFRIAAVVLSAVGVILFGSAITSALCRATPICDIPIKAVNYLRSGGAQDVGRMLAEEITPERVRRTAEFVRNAIYKYNQLQEIVNSEHN